jgi:hypothetical protein
LNELLESMLETETMSVLKEHLSPTQYRWIKMDMSELSPSEQSELYEALKGIEKSNSNLVS